MISLGDRIHSLFPPALAVNILGHVDIRVTHVVPHNLRPCAFAPHMAGMHVRKFENTLYRANWPSPDLRKNCLPTFAGKVIFGCVRATSATDVPMLAFTGVAR